MLDISSIEDIKALRESFDVECKLAQGRDGKGKRVGWGEERTPTKPLGNAQY